MTVVVSLKYALFIMRADNQGQGGILALMTLLWLVSLAPKAKLQQVMMTLFSLSELMDEKKDYQKACIGIVKKRVAATIEGLGIEVGENPLFDYYYGLIDFEFWARKNLGEDVVTWMKQNVHPLDIVFRLAEDHGIVLLNGSAITLNWAEAHAAAILEAWYPGEEGGTAIAETMAAPCATQVIGSTLSNGSASLFSLLAT